MYYTELSRDFIESRGDCILCGSPCNFEALCEMKFILFSTKIPKVRKSLFREWSF